MTPDIVQQEAFGTPQCLRMWDARWDARTVLDPDFGCAGVLAVYGQSGCTGAHFEIRTRDMIPRMSLPHFPECVPIVQWFPYVFEKRVQKVANDKLAWSACLLNRLRHLMKPSSSWSADPQGKDELAC